MSGFHGGRIQTASTYDQKSPVDRHICRKISLASVQEADGLAVGEIGQQGRASAQPVSNFP